MNTKAIERIKGFCCEVDEAQWNELVRVADEVGAPMCRYIVSKNTKKFFFKYVGSHGTDSIVGWVSNPKGKADLIPYPDFLAKLKGEEKWQPKAGEMVEVSGDDCAVEWYSREFVATREGKHFCWTETGTAVSHWPSIRPLRPTITRTEAESLLGKRIID